MNLVILTLFSSAGISLTSASHSDHHHVPLINCPSCQHHVCDFKNTIQCEVCQIYVPHHGQPPQDTRCIPTGHCHSDDHHQFCCDTEACVASFFRELHITSTTTQQITNTASAPHEHNFHKHNHVPLINCPSCQHHVCDFKNSIQCEVCQIYVPHHGQPPQDTRCVPIGHCHSDDHHQFCCDTEACVASFFRELHITSTTTQQITNTASAPHEHNFHKHNHEHLINCPSCEHHVCDFKNTIQCEVCQIYVPHHGQPPQDTRCVPTGHCHSYRDYQCCDTEACVASFFRELHITSTTTQQITNTASAPHEHNFHKHNHEHLINCPSCEHHVCDFKNTIQCEVCQIYVPHQGQPPLDTRCIPAGHCHSDIHRHCCDTEACLASFFREFHITNTTTQHITNTDSMVHCPTCHGGDCDFVNRDTCHVCKFDLHPGKLPHVHCLNGNEHCTENHNTRCCSDESCIARAFGSWYPGTSSTHSTTSREIHVTVGAYGPYFQTFRSSTTLPTTTGHTKVNTSNPTTFKHTSVATPTTISNVSTLPSYTTSTTTTPSSTSTYSTSSLRANSSEATTPLTPRGTTGSVSSATTVSFSTDIPSNCSDSITNCATLKRYYGVCHAIPVQRDMYDIAFLRCRATCNLCKETYQPLTNPSTSLQVTTSSFRTTTSAEASTTIIKQSTKMSETTLTGGNFKPIF
ncbi:uncharacterized protein LOC134279619 isoform X1 [Saccostrea cucullata]|uniref:uncharacterized protein LOC134279619 isoform X1 n=1 Tax=Saccostrea cuccullata TaxID=36930 RepID=UPI002ED65666